MGRGVWGIDVSKYSVKAAKLERKGDAVELTGLDVIQYTSAGTGEDGALDDQIKDALADLKANNKIGSDKVVLSLPGHSTFNRLVKLPPVDDAKIPEIVKYEAQSQIPFNIDEVIWDYQLIDRVYGPGEEKEVILFAIKRDIVEQFLDNIKEVGLNVDAVQFGPVALYNFLCRDQGVGDSAVALDMGSDNTDLVIVDGTKFWIRNLPITGNDITRALQKAFNIPFGEAEKLKLKAGQSQQAQKIFNAIQPVLRDLVGEIHRSIGYYKSISKQIRFDKIILMGNATRTLNFQKFLSQSLQMPAARVQKLNAIGVGNVDGGLLNSALPSLGTAVGLALQGVDEAPNAINLLPPVFRKQKEIKKKQPFVVGIAIVLYVLVGAMWMNASGEVDNLMALNTNAGSAVQRLGQVQQQYEQAKDLSAIEKKIAPISGIASERDLILKVMDQINPNVPDNKKTSSGDVLDTQKLWILEWEFREQDISGEKLTGKVRTIPSERALHVTLEVAISKRGSSGEAEQFVLKHLLNVKPGSDARADASRACIVEAFNLKRGKTSGKEAGWELTVDTNISRPLAMRALKLSDEGEDLIDDEEKMFTRIVLTFHIPMGEENRTKAEKPAEPKKEGN